MKFHDTLNEKIWDLETNDMLPEVKEKLKEIAEAFIEFLEIPTDAILDKVITGSSASYNYNEFSDLDLHIIVDYDKVHEDCPLVNGYLNSLKKQFNDNHDITIHGVPVELYAEQKDQGTVHNGLYSLQTGWIDKPEKIKPTDNDAAVEAKYYEIKDMVDKCDDSEQAQELLEKIYTMRKAGLAEAGEFCTENLAFKKLRNEGCMDKLRQLKKEQIDKQLSLESYNENMDYVLEAFKNAGFPYSYSPFDNRYIVLLQNGQPEKVEGIIFSLDGWMDIYCKQVWYDEERNRNRKTLKRYPIRENSFSEAIQKLESLIKGTIDNKAFENLLPIFKSLLENKNESIKESEDELTLEDKLINILTKDGWNHLNGRGGELLEKDNISISLYVDSVIFNEFEDDEKELPLETEEDLQNILNQIDELKKNESVDEEKEYENIVIFGAIPFINSKLRDTNLFYITKPYTGKTRKYDGVLVKVPEDDTEGFEMWLQEQKLKYADLEDLPKNESVNEQYINVSSSIYIITDRKLVNEMLEVAKTCKSIYDFEKTEIAKHCELMAKIKRNKFTGVDLEELVDNIRYTYEDAYIDTTLDEWVIEDNKIRTGSILVTSEDDYYYESLEKFHNNIKTALGEEMEEDKEQPNYSVVIRRRTDDEFVEFYGYETEEEAIKAYDALKDDLDRDFYVSLDKKNAIGYETIKNNYFKESVNREKEMNEDDKFNYMMLDRLRTDCEYFLGNGNGSERNLWAGNVEDQIAEMRKIYDKLPEKPEWLSLEDIDKYEKDMLALKEQPIEEDLATLEVKIDQAQSNVQDIVNMIQDVKEDFDFDKAYNTIKLAEAEE